MAPIWFTLEVRPHIAKYIYLAGFVITAVASWLLRDYSEKALQHIPQLRKCNTPDGTYENSCAGKGAVLRISFGNFIFFALHFVLLIGVRKTTQARRLVHTGKLLAFWMLPGKYTSISKEHRHQVLVSAAADLRGDMCKPQHLYVVFSCAHDWKQV